MSQERRYYVTFSIEVDAKSQEEALKRGKYKVWTDYGMQHAELMESGGVE
jgi:hypothetical protein